MIDDSNGDEQYRPKTPEEEAKTRIDSLQKNVIELEQELKTLEGKYANRDPEAAKNLEQENQELSKRVERLETVLSGILDDMLKPRHKDDATLQHEVLREAAVQYCKMANIDADIWRSIVY